MTFAGRMGASKGCHSLTYPLDVTCNVEDSKERLSQEEHHKRNSPTMFYPKHPEAQHPKSSSILKGQSGKRGGVGSGTEGVSKVKTT